MNNALKLVAVLFIGLMAVNFARRENQGRQIQAIPAASANAGCSVADVTVRSSKAGFVDTCRHSACPRLKGVAVLHNACPTPLHIQMRITGYDKAGDPVATNTYWPNSVSAIPPGDFTFSLDYSLDHDPAMVRFAVEPASVRD